MGQRAGLLSDGLGDSGVCMADTDNSDTGERIKVLLALCVVQINAGAACESDG